MSNYYFLIAAFPPLSLETKPELSFKEVKDLLRMNLRPKDYIQVQRLLRSIDLYNIRALWLGEPFDEKGQFSKNELQEELLVRQTLPEYLIEYLAKYETTEERLTFFSSLYVALYQEMIPKARGFLKKYYEFDRELRLILGALRAKLAGKDLIREMQFEDPQDPLIAELLAQKDMPELIVAREYEDLKAKFMENITDPQKLSAAILQYKFDRIEEMDEEYKFGIDRVLNYIARLNVVEELFGQDKEKGMEALSQYE